MALAVLTALLLLTGLIAASPSQAAEPPEAGDVLLVVGRGSKPSKADTRVSERIEAMGHDVVVRDDGEFSRAGADEADLVVIADSVDAKQIPSDALGTATSIVAFKANLFDDLGFVSDGGFGTIGGTKSAAIVDESHPMAANLTGKVDVLTRSSTVSFAEVGGEVTVIAKRGSSDRALLFVYESRATLGDGTAAPGIRIGGLFAKGTITRINDAGWRLFEAMINYGIRAEDGGGGGEGAATWMPADATIEVTIGQVESLTPRLLVEETIADVSLVLSPELDGWISGLEPLSGDLAPETYAVGLAAAPPAGAAAGDVASGTLTLRSGTDEVATLAITVATAAVDPESAATEPAIPAPSRITTIEGATFVNDEVIVIVDLDATDPLAAAQAAAAEVDGELIGAVPAAGVYQIRVAGPSDIAGLQTIIAQLEALEEIDSAILHTFAEVLADPDDEQWDSWDATAGGNNFHLERIGAREAWDVTTGSSTVGVGIVDAGIDGGHEDLVGNLISVDNLQTDFGLAHGTHVAGTACAQGNNSIGVSGVAWDCAMRGYDALVPGTDSSLDGVRLIEGMVAAADDGARVVNMSFGYQGSCASYSTPAFQTGASDFARGLRRAMTVARARGNDVLWVKAAGNDSCDGDLHPELKLVDDFPTNYLVVASTNESDAVSDFSNTGDVVQIAAPGGNDSPDERILSTVPRTCRLFGRFFCNAYSDTLPGGAPARGTSMAAPQVTGAAALLFSAVPTLTAAQAKECLIRGSEDSLVAGEGYGILDIPDSLTCAQDDPLGLPPEVDLMFALDLTGSMGGELSRVKAEATAVISGLEELAPSTDFRFGVVSFEDNPGSYDSSPCGSSYDASYGASGDAPYRLDQTLTADSAAVQSAINSLSLGSGNDGPESYGRAIWELGQADQAGTQGWRTGALRLTVMFGDNVPHDTNLGEGFGGELPTPAGLPIDTGREPGRDGAVCTGDDIDFHDALDDLEASGNRLLYVDSSGSSAFREAWSLWSSLTGGSIALADTSGAPLGGADLTETVADLIRSSGR